MRRRVQAALVPHTVDFDIENACLIIAHQLVEQLQLEDAAMFASEVDMLRRLALDRSAVITELGLTPALGKDLILKAINGRSLPASLVPNPTLARVRRVGIFLRWLACSCLPAEHAFFQTIELEKNGTDRSRLVECVPEQQAQMARNLHSFCVVATRRGPHIALLAANRLALVEGIRFVTCRRHASGSCFIAFGPAGRAFY